MAGLLDGKVAIITGAGGGIGRCYAHMFAREGARVVVNDLGGSRDGTGQTHNMADQVVNEIKEMGGQAVANYASVSTKEGADSIVKTALDTWGRADILINNAGILRDKSFLKMEEGMWDLVIAVHLKGTYLCSQAFALHVKERAEAGDRGGRIINTSSYAGLKGNFGQTNYSAAKAGIYGLTLTWSMELAKLGVTVNCIAPMAKTRMTEDITAVPDTMQPEQVAPMALFLASDLAANVNGRVFGVHGQQLLEYKMLMTEGVTKPGQDLWTAPEIARHLDEIGATGPAPAAAGAASGGAAAAPITDAQIIATAFQLMPQVFVPEKAAGWTANIQFDITGGQPWTVEIAGGKCTTKQGKQGTPTCVVTVDEKTYAAVVQGKEKAEQAFMAGKIKATNLGDMMKFGAAFDMKKARALAEQARPAAAAAPAGGAAAGAAAGPLTDAQIIAAAFQLMPQVFVPEKAAGWTANVQFDITGGTPWTVEVAGGKCTTREGKHGTPTCVVTVDEKTYAAVVQGKEKAEQAFMAGKIKATNLGDMMKFGAAFDMKKARQLAEQARPAAAAGAAPAAAAPAGDAQVIAAAFKLMPQVFVPEKAAGWTANIQFDITGGQPWTVEVANGKCTTREGKHGTPTCVVTVDEKTYAAVVQGKEKAEQAFMAGKIKATNLGDMMKFGAAFDMKKARALAEQAAPAAATAASRTGAAAPAGGGGASDPQALLARAFELMPAHFKPEGASGWTAALGFQVAGGEDWTLEVKDGKAASRRGLPANATCTVSTSLADLAAVLSGELKAEQAFMQGKLKASNLGDMMKFGRAFDLKAVAGELRKGGAPSGGAAAGGARAGGMNRDVIGKVHRGGEPIFLRPEWCTGYAKATQDENPAYLDPKHKGGLLAPPMVAVRIAKDALFRAVTDEELGADMLRLVHGEQDMEWFHPLRPWDLCATRSEVTAIETKSTGEVLTTDGRIYVGGQLACRVRSSMFIRDPNAKKGEKKEAAAPTARPTPLVAKKITVQPDQSVRYTEASGDNNPIHTDPEIAKLAGFKGVILHGLCTMAFAGKTVVDELCWRDPTKLRRLAVRFSRPVYMTDTLTVEIWPADATQGRKAFGLRVINQDGDEVITNGLAEIDA